MLMMMKMMTVVVGWEGGEEDEREGGERVWAKGVKIRKVGVVPQGLGHVHMDGEYWARTGSGLVLHTWRVSLRPDDWGRIRRGSSMCLICDMAYGAYPDDVATSLVSNFLN